ALVAQIMRAPRPARVGCKDYARAALDMDVTGAIEYARSIHAVINSSSQMVPAGHKERNAKDGVMAGRNVDLDKFRLRRFAERRIAIGEMEVPEEPVSLAEAGAVIESSLKAKYVKRVGAEQYEMVAAVSGSRRRLAAAFGTDERNVIHEYMRRMNAPQPVVEVPSAEAPVHEV